MTPAPLGPFSLGRMCNAAERVRLRLLRAAGALDAAGVQYAVLGDFAVASWVSRIDESAVRNTQDVDLLIRRADFDAAKSALEQAGFVHRHAAGMTLFLDGPDAKARDALHIVFANEKVLAGEVLPNPDVSESERAEHFNVLSLEPLVRIKLTAFRDKDRTHLRDMIEVGLIGPDWPDRLPPELAARLRHLLDTPDG